MRSLDQIEADIKAMRGRLDWVGSQAYAAEHRHKAIWLAAYQESRQLTVAERDERAFLYESKEALFRTSRRLHGFWVDLVRERDAALAQQRKKVDAERKAKAKSQLKRILSVNIPKTPERTETPTRGYCLVEVDKVPPSGDHILASTQTKRADVTVYSNYRCLGSKRLYRSRRYEGFDRRMVSEVTW